MTYAVVTLPFLAATLVVTLLSAVRPRFGRRMAASALTAAVLVVLTVVFDNAMIAAGLFSYPADRISGVRIGLAPIEDFAYPLCAAFLLPALFALVRRRSRA